MPTHTKGATADAGKPARRAVQHVVEVAIPEAFASTSSAKNSAGSERQAKVTSRAAHAFKGRARVERRGRGEESGQSKQIGEENQIAGERDRRIKAAEGHHQAGQHDRRQGHRWARRRNTHVVVSLMTMPFCMSLDRS